jgi:hypothetical protein
MDAVNFVANYNKDFGSPGLVHTMQVLKEQYKNLNTQEKVLYNAFLKEIALVLQNNK